MARARSAVWKGRVTFGLVGIPVQLVPALDSSERTGFHLLHRKDLAPIEYRKFCSKEEREVPDDEVVRGQEVSNGKWAVVEKEELATARKASAEEVEAHVLEILQFVHPDALSPVSFDHPYYMVPDEGGAKGFSVLKSALLDAGLVGLGRLRLRATPHLAALVPVSHGVALVLLRPFEEIAEAPGRPLPAPQPAEKKMARLLIDQMTAEAVDPAKYPDRYQAVLKKLLASKHAAAGVPRAKAPAEGEKKGEVVDLMEALRASLASRGGKSRRKGRSHAA